MPSNSLRSISTTVYLGLSVDGFIARADHTVDFLDPPPADHQPAPATIEPGDMGFGDFLASVDVLIMGRNTYEFVVNSGADWPYGELNVVVLTTKGIAIADELTPTVSTMSGSPDEVLATLVATGVSRAYVDGGAVVQQFLAAGLIDRMVLTRVPILIGTGITLFGALPADRNLIHESTTAYTNGMVQTTYRLAR